MNTYDFVEESNLIEGITRAPTQAEIDEHNRFIELSVIILLGFCIIFTTNR
ncbi:MAG: hypothetical protein GWN00_20005 [Aliifodinibius sp.]|nr:hypothetical protein [Fodinibius sp.]NIY27006.1 hypothetical protein [Fodinibius sp.]